MSEPTRTMSTCFPSPSLPNPLTRAARSPWCTRRATNSNSATAAKGTTSTSWSTSYALHSDSSSSRATTETSSAASAFDPISDPDLHFAEVKRLWVRPDLRREGIGLALMHEIEIHAKELGYVTLFLETGPAQPEALALYRSHGWTEIEKYPAGVFSHPPAHRFSKDL